MVGVVGDGSDVVVVSQFDHGLRVDRFDCRLCGVGAFSHDNVAGQEGAEAGIGGKPSAGQSGVAGAEDDVVTEGLGYRFAELGFEGRSDVDL